MTVLWRKMSGVVKFWTAFSESPPTAAMISELPFLEYLFVSSLLHLFFYSNVVTPHVRAFSFTFDFIFYFEKLNLRSNVLFIM